MYIVVYDASASDGTWKHSNLICKSSKLIVSEIWFGIFQNAWFLIFCTLLWRVIEMSCVHVIHTTQFVEEIEPYLYVLSHFWFQLKQY